MAFTIGGLVGRLVGTPIYGGIKLGQTAETVVSSFGREFSEGYRLATGQRFPTPAIVKAGEQLAQKVRDEVMARAQQGPLPTGPFPGPSAVGGAQDMGRPIFFGASWGGVPVPVIAVGLGILALVMMRRN